MATETDTEIEASVLAQLASTEYACPAITRLNGGTANFVYRGVIPAGDKLQLRKENEGNDDNKLSIIIKHTTDFVALNRSFKLDAERCTFEAFILKSLNTFSPVSDTPLQQSQPIMVRTPKLYQFYAANHTQIMEDLPESVNLKTWLLSTEAGMNIEKLAAKAIGRALGSWISSFHSWTLLEQQAELRQTLAKNISMQKLKYAINYDLLVNVLVDRHPHILEESRSDFEQVRALAEDEMSIVDDSKGANWGPIHGDFWTGNILMAKNNTTMFVTDWEMTQVGMRALDLGQMFAELYEIKLFKGNYGGVWIIEGLLEAYENWNEEMAFRTAVHMGVHLVCWSDVPGWGSQSQVEDVIRIGRDLVVRGWKRDKDWFMKDDTLKYLFQ